MPEEVDLPKTIGVIGVGTIGAAVVRGLCSGGLGAPRFVLSPRGAAKAAQLAREFPEDVRVAAGNQEVVDSADLVIVAVLPQKAEEVLAELTFKPSQQVVSFVSTLKLARLRELIMPAAECAMAMPLPAVAKRRGATILVPPLPVAKALFSTLGSCVAVQDEPSFRRMQCITALMGDLYKRQLTAQKWLSSHGIPDEEAAAWVGAGFATMIEDSSRPGPETLAHLVAEQTPGGLNEMVWKEQEADGAYEALQYSLDSVHHRVTTGSADGDLVPAAKRARKD